MCRNDVEEDDVMYCILCMPHPIMKNVAVTRDTQRPIQRHYTTSQARFQLKHHVELLDCSIVCKPLLGVVLCNVIVVHFGSVGRSAAVKEPQKVPVIGHMQVLTLCHSHLSFDRLLQRLYEPLSSARCWRAQVPRMCGR
jgi:hypothetical protein